jgi:hypothetical protein
VLSTLFDKPTAVTGAAAAASALALTCVVFAALAIVPTHAPLLSNASPASADAAVIRAYADGPVVYLNKWESRYMGYAGVGAAGGYLSSVTGGWGAGAAGALAAMGIGYIDQMVNSGACILVKMWYWNPWWVRGAWYRWWPCS